MAFWADRIANTKDKVALHVERWRVWDVFIDTLGTPEKQVDEVTIKDDDNEKAFKEKLNATGARWSKKTVCTSFGLVCFDASFGSLNSTSDLDINILSQSTKVLDKWIQYMKEWHKHNAGKTFTNYYDSNFYFEPCMKESIIPLRLHLVRQKFNWTTDTSYMAEFNAVKAYADAYTNNTKVLEIMPNPERMTQCDEIRYLEQCKKYACEFTVAYLNYMKNHCNASELRASYLRFAQCKIEGIVSIPALAICGVFGYDLMNEFITNRKDTKGLEIAVYEMLRNLQMHSHDGRYKSKYANRLIKLVSHTDNLCPGRRNSDVTLRKTNNATLEDIKPAVIFLMDFIDGNVCAEYKTGRLSIANLIQFMESKILGRDLSKTFHKIQLRFW